MIIQEGQITLIVEDTHATLDAIRAIVGEMETEGAFIVTSEERVDVESQVSIASMAIRVPAARFDEVMDRLAALAVRLEERRETAEDITEEYVDLQGRLASMEAARDRLRHFMAEAETVEELLRVEPKLAEREAEIESLSGRLKYLTESAQLSQVEIKLRPSVLSKQVAALWPARGDSTEGLRGAGEEPAGGGGHLDLLWDRLTAVVGCGRVGGVRDLACGAALPCSASSGGNRSTSI